jgi:hypothetical protein
MLTPGSQHPKGAHHEARATRLALAGLAVLMAATLAACGSDTPNPPPVASPAPTVPTTMPPATAAPATTPAPTRSTVGTGGLPQPIRELHQGDRLFGVYWAAAALGELSPVERRLQTLGYPASSGDLDCDQGARRWLGVPATITARVAVYFGTERHARAFAQRVPVRPGPHGHAAAILYCLD